MCWDHGSAQGFQGTVITTNINSYNNNILCGFLCPGFFQVSICSLILSLDLGALPDSEPALLESD